MKIFYGFLVILLTAILFLLPVPDGIRDFVSDISNDTFESTVTGAGVTNATVTLADPLYNNNRNFASVTSSNTTDSPSISAYNATTQNVTIIGLAADTTRTLTISYSVFTLPGGDAVETLCGYIPLFWILICCTFPVIAVVAIVLL